MIKRDKKGFTLIELLAVIVILAIIIIIAVPNVLTIQENLKKNSTISSALLFYKAADLCISSESEYTNCSTGSNTILSKYYDGKLNNQDVSVDSKGNITRFKYEDSHTGYAIAISKNNIKKDDIQNANVILANKVLSYEISETNDSIILNSAYKAPFNKFILYGNSVDGNSVGTLDESTGNYTIGIVASGRNLFNPNGTGSKTPDNNYFGYMLDTNKRYTMSLKLKEGKSIPKISFGIVYVRSGNTAPNAVWFVGSSSGLTRTLGNSPSYSFNYLTVGVYPGKQENLDTIADAFDIALYEGVYTEATMPKYEPYKEPVIVDIYLNNPLRIQNGYIDYIDFNNNTVTYYDESGVSIVSQINLPEIPISSGTNYITVNDNIVLQIQN